jgi:cyanophycinase-like exopeptidase
MDDAENAPSSQLPFGVSVERLGPDADAQPQLSGPALLLQGDGTPLDTAVQAQADHVADAPLDLVVLAASFPGGDNATPECDALTGLPRLHSCTTVTIPDPRGADAAAVADTVRRAEVVYVAGGNQCNYVEWRGTAVHDAVIDVVERGGGVGGGSAGLAVQGDVVYDGCAGSVRSGEALSDPYHRRISFSESLFEWPILDPIITDSHFQERNRMGRLITFVARQIEERGAESFYGLGVNAATAVVIGPKKIGTVYGGHAYLVHADHPPETMEPGTPLTFSDVEIVRLGNGTKYDFSQRPLDEAYVRSVQAGSLSATPYHSE